MAYNVRIDENGRPIPEGLERIHIVTVPTNTVGEKLVTLPNNRIFQIAFKQVPVQISMKINGYPDVIPVDPGEGFGTFENLRELKVIVEQTGTAPIIIMMFE